MRSVSRESRTGNARLDPAENGNRMETAVAAEGERSPGPRQRAHCDQGELGGWFWVRARPSPQAPGPTFEIEVAGAIGVLRDCAGVNLERVHIARVPGHHHVVPLVVIDWFV